MKSRVVISVMLALVLTVLCGCSGGSVSGVKTEIGQSDKFTSSEIKSAMNIVINAFKKEFNGCTLTEIVYDEEISNEAAPAFAQQYGADEAIILVSSFDVDESGGDGSLDPNRTYTGYQWVLIRSNGGRWSLKTWGYG